MEVGFLKVCWLGGWLVLLTASGAASSLLAASDPPVDSAVAAVDASGPAVILVLGAPGEAGYEQAFQRQQALWQDAVRRANGTLQVVGEPSGEGTTRDFERLRDLVVQLASDPADGRPLWLILVGHGSFDGKEAKFNLRGPDLTADVLAEWLAPLKQPQAVVVASSASAPFLAKLSRPGRVVVVATRSGYEQNYVRFGEYLAEVVADPAGDLDRDGQTSLLEAFLRAAHLTAEFYRNDGRLVTEHALIDDTGDGRGTPAEWFRGTRAVKKAAEGAVLDGLRAHQWHLLRSPGEQRLTSVQRERRDALEREIDALRSRKENLPEADYLAELEQRLIELARIYEAADPGKP